MAEEGSVVSRNASEVGKSLAGKYLTFKLANEDYGLAILKVQEIIQMQEVTRVPNTPDFIRGVINLRGRVIPVIDLSKKFGMELSEDTDKTCIIVVEINDNGNSVTMGVIIDEVSEVIDISPSDIQKTPSFGSGINTNFILGIGKVGKSVKMLLDIDKALTLSDVSVVANLDSN